MPAVRLPTSVQDSGTGVPLPPEWMFHIPKSVFHFPKSMFHFGRNRCSTRPKSVFHFGRNTHGARHGVGRPAEAQPLPGVEPYMSEPQLRAKVRRNLLKVEQLHALVRAVYYGQRGRISADRGSRADIASSRRKKTPEPARSSVPLLVTTFMAPPPERPASAEVPARDHLELLDAPAAPPEAEEGALRVRPGDGEPRVHGTLAAQREPAARGHLHAAQIEDLVSNRGPGGGSSVPTKTAVREASRRGPQGNVHAQITMRSISSTVTVSAVRS